MKHLKICVVGSHNFHTGIGKIAYALCEMFSRFATVSFIPVDGNPIKFVELPNGRKIKICEDKSEVVITFYCAILWNGIGDKNIDKMPNGGLRYAVVAFDSDKIPRRWVNIINERFNGLYCTNKNLEKYAKESDVNVPIGTLPLALDLKSLLSKDISLKGNKGVTIGCVAAFHPRKNHDLSIKAFISLQERYKNIKLKIHSNLNLNNYYEYCKSLALHSPFPENIELTCSNFNEIELNNFINEIDIFINVSRGEGFSIGPREAAALGKILVLSSVPPHLDFSAVPGCFIVEATQPIPCVYPELDGIVAGYQYNVATDDIENALIKAIQYKNEKNSLSDIFNRQLCASKWDFSQIGFSYLNALNPNVAHLLYDPRCYEDMSYVPEEIKIDLKKSLGENGEKIGLNKTLLVQMHDGGFFSIFNIFMAHLVHNLGVDKYFKVLPDWRVSGFLDRMSESSGSVMSFCYGKPEDGNVFNKLFFPLDENVNYVNSNVDVINSKDVERYFQVKNEPLFTNKYADLLYKSQEFKNFRLRYNKILHKYIKLLPHIEERINKFCKQFNGKFVIAAHVRHPSHVIEQLDGSMPTPMDYIEKIKTIVLQRNLKEWCIFLATDQERTVNAFLDTFGDKVLFYRQVRRLTDIEDKDFDAIPAEQKRNEGFQLQHKVAKNVENWSVSMAEEVMLDAWTMARCNILLHVVSNVSTAVSYIGTDVEFISMRKGNI